MAMNAPAARFLLRSSGRNLENARRALDVAMGEAKRDVVIAKAAGVPISEIAKLIGMSRQSIYTILDEAKRKAAS